MGISLSHRDCRVSEQIPNIRQRNAGADQPCRAGVAQVVNRKVRNLRCLAGLLEAGRKRYHSITVSARKDQGHSGLVSDLNAIRRFSAAIAPSLIGMLRRLPAFVWDASR